MHFWYKELSFYFVLIKIFSFLELLFEDNLKASNTKSAVNVLIPAFGAFCKEIKILFITYKYCMYNDHRYDPQKSDHWWVMVTWMDGACRKLGKLRT
jgi:hypothetical protein